MRFKVNEHRQQEKQGTHKLTNIYQHNFPLEDVQDKKDARNKKVMILKSIYPLENRRHCPRHHHFIDMPFLRLKIGSAAFLSI